MSDDVISRRMAKLYFKTTHGDLAKSIATSIRDQNSMCNLIDQQHFQGPEDVESCSLVMIQKSAPKSKLIASCYENFGSDGVEIVFFDDEGNVTHDGPENNPAPQKSTEVPVAEAGTTGTDPDPETDRPARVSEGYPDSDAVDTDD